MRTRRGLLAAVGASATGLGAAATGTITVDGLSPAWTTWRTRGHGGSYHNGFVASENRVFMTDHIRLLVFSREDGSLRNRTRLLTDSAGPLAGLSIFGDQVYGGVKTLEAFNLDGERLWHLEPSPDVMLTWAPVTAGESVIAGFTGASAQTRLVASTRDGERTWETPLPGDSVALTGGDDGVFALTTNEGDGPTRVHRVDLETGEMRWERTVQLPSDAPPASISSGDGVVAIGGHGVSTLDAETGQTRWQKTDPRLNQGTIVDGQLVVAGGVSGDSELDRRQSAGVARSFEPSSGEELWRLPFEGKTLHPPAPYADGFLIADRGAHSLRALSPDGKSRWTLGLNLPPKNSLGSVGKPLPGDPHVIGADRSLVGIEERGF